MKWVTRARPKVDRVACPWLIKRFVDPNAEFLYVPPDQVMEVAKRGNCRGFQTRLQQRPRATGTGVVRVRRAVRLLPRVSAHEERLAEERQDSDQASVH